MIRSSHFIFRVLLVLVCVCCLADSAQARQKQPPIEPNTLALINKLAQKPELMNLSYLQYVVGLPENGRSQVARSKKSYFWYQEPKRIVAYQLDQNGPQAGMVTSSAFTFNMPDSKVSFADVEKMFGTGHQEVFDHRAYPTRVIAVSPTTHISFTQPHDTFRVKHITVGYNGPPLPPPPLDEIELAYNFRKAEALMACQNGKGHVGIPFLQGDVMKQPGNARAHLQLAQAYRKSLMLNQAIASYREAMRLSGGDPEIVAACQAGLSEMKVLPVNQPGSGQRTFLAGSKARNDKGFVLGL
ncbi:MAG: hypothetical protein K8F91_07575 [Candidatus Obscuribacterales bacterium]|nr:hypothetical protein [Candidatus Obscuribacterales bacterium]